MHRDHDLEQRTPEEVEIERQLEPFQREIEKNWESIYTWEAEIRMLGPAQSLGKLIINRQRQIADAKLRIAEAERRIQQILDDAETKEDVI